MFSARNSQLVMAALWIVMASVMAATGCSTNKETQSDGQVERTPAEKPEASEARASEATCPKATIKTLRAVNVPCTTDIAIGYEVNTRHTCGDFDLLVRIEHDDKVIFERLLSMGSCYQTDADGTRHFHGSTHGKLPEIVCADRDELEVAAFVIPHDAHGDATAALGHEDARVEGSEDSIWGARVPGGWPEAKTLGSPGLAQASFR